MNKQKIKIIEDDGRLVTLEVKVSGNMFENKLEFEMFSSYVYDLVGYIGPLEDRINDEEEMWVFDLTDQKFYLINKKSEDELRTKGNELISLYSPETKTMYPIEIGKIIIQYYIDLHSKPNIESI